jgi:hypothetical protein
MVQRIIEARQAGDTTKRIRAIVISPMNALCNSPFKELEKDLCYGYLLTNDVILEYILTRQNPLDQQVIRAAQGADNKLISIGTSATMASEGSAEDRNAVVASIASQLFGTQIPASTVVTETLERVTKGGLPTAEELRQALEHCSAVGEAPVWSAEQLRRHPLVRWVERKLGLRSEDDRADGKWVRSQPLPFREAADELAGLSGLDPRQARQGPRAFLLAAYQVEVAPNRRFFADTGGSAVSPSCRWM